jgi:hypothetical protein
MGREREEEKREEEQEESKEGVKREAHKQVSGPPRIA